MALGAANRVECVNEGDSEKSVFGFLDFLLKLFERFGSKVGYEIRI